MIPEELLRESNPYVEAQSLVYPSAHILKCYGVVAGVDSVAVEVEPNLNLCGYLYAQVGAVLGKSWKRRWFSLDGEGTGMLTYFEDKSSNHTGVNEKGKIDMRHVQSVEPDPNDDPERGSPGLFLATKDPQSGKHRVWEFHSSTIEDRDMWVVSLRAAKEQRARTAPPPLDSLVATLAVAKKMRKGSKALPRQSARETDKSDPIGATASPPRSATPPRSSEVGEP